MIHPDDRRSAGLAVFIAIASAAGINAVQWAFEEAKLALARHRERRAREEQS